jgi:hypothetical protein
MEYVEATVTHGYRPFAARNFVDSLSQCLQANYLLPVEVHWPPFLYGRRRITVDAIDLPVCKQRVNT